MTTFYRLKENGSILDYTEIEKVYDEQGNVTNVPAFIQEQYIETERKIIQLVDGSFAFEDEVNLEEEAKHRAEKEFNEAKNAKLAEVDTWTANKITGGFISNGVRYDSDMETQTTMQGIALNVNSERFTTDYPNGIPVRGYDEGSTEKTIHYLTAEEVLMFCADLSEHIGRCKLDGWTMQQAVHEATTKEELDSIILD